MSPVLFVFPIILLPSKAWRKASRRLSYANAMHLQVVILCTEYRSERGYKVTECRGPHGATHHHQISRWGELRRTRLAWLVSIFTLLFTLLFPLSYGSPIIYRIWYMSYFKPPLWAFTAGKIFSSTVPWVMTTTQGAPVIEIQTSMIMELRSWLRVIIYLILEIIKTIVLNLASLNSAVRASSPTQPARIRASMRALASSADSGRLINQSLHKYFINISESRLQKSRIERISISERQSLAQWSWHVQSK